MDKTNYQRIIEGIREIFPEAEGIEFTPEFVLGELPEWDSMAAVNLQTYLQEQFTIELPLELLSDETKIEDIVAFVRNPVSIPDA
jgi:acyl carrier protein